MKTSQRENRKQKTGLVKEFAGLWKWYRANGKLLQIGRFEDGEQVGLWKRYHDNGKLYDIGKYIDGKKVGEWKTYDKNGTLKRAKTVK